ncbi:MAG: hypothetical protein PQJ59_02665 [Spirochaetales bacterium]|nr:hypothetical protein [Spirochaetales bacterium]
MDDNKVKLLEPGSFEPGFFIETTLPASFFHGWELPPGIALHHVREPDYSRCPSLFVLPHKEYGSLTSGSIPVIYYLEDLPQHDRRESFSYLLKSSTNGEGERAFSSYFSREYFSLPGGYAHYGKGRLYSGMEFLTLTHSESLILEEFLLRKNNYLSFVELERILEGKCVKVLLSRLRIKIGSFLEERSPLRLDFVSVKSSGYYLWITVDKLWKSL